MPPEERAAHRKEMQEHWKNMPPEERAARRKEMHERLEKMTPDERKQFKHDMQGMNSAANHEKAHDTKPAR